MDRETRCPQCRFLFGMHRIAGPIWSCRHCGFRGRIASIAKGDDAMEIPWDEVHCEFTQTRRVTSDTVRVYVTATLSLAGAEAARVKPVLTDALRKVIDADWRFASLQRQENESGMEQVTVLASTRTAEQQSAGLVERLANACRPGLKLKLIKIDPRPPRAEIDKAISELRRLVYSHANQELAALNESLPSDTSPWRVGAIIASSNVNTPDLARPAHMNPGDLGIVRHAMSAEGGWGEGGEDVRVATQIKIEAKVTFKRPSVPIPPNVLGSPVDRR